MSRYIDIDSLPMPIPDDCASYDELNEFAYAIAEADEVYIPTWIPCEERLPDVGEIVLLCGRMNMVCGYRDSENAWLSMTGDGWERYMDFPDGAKILAWMPIEPYKEGE